MKTQNLNSNLFKKLFKSKNSFQVFVFLLVFFLKAHCSRAQQGYFKTGWPAVTGTYTNLYDSTHYSDTVRANITGYSSTGGGLIRLTLDASHKYGTFYPNDHILLIQMTTGLGTNTGNWEEMTVAAVGSGYIDIATPIRTYTPNDGSNPNARLQVIKIPYWESLRLSSRASLECHAWDGYTGGIVCFVTRRLWIEDGRISAAGKGFFDSYSVGQGGLGGPGDSTYGNTGGGLSQYYAPMCTTPAPTIGNYANGFNGQNGEGLETYCIGANGTSPSGGTSYTYPNSYNDQNLTLGNAGGFSNTTGGGKGANGGGHGGKGGANALGNPGYDGGNGGAGGKGGNEGHSGRGGGIILFKADTVQFACDYVQQGAWEDAAFWINGQNGEDGKSGGKGGDGGACGKGQTGSQVSNFLNYSGGWGGAGKPGKGAQGGRPGSGGQGGYLRFYYNYAPQCYITGTGSYMEAVDAIYANERIMWFDGYNGKPGKGGQGGTATSKTDAIKFSVLTPYDTCAVSGSGPVWSDVCDCNKVFDEVKDYYSKYNYSIYYLTADSLTIVSNLFLPLTADYLTGKQSKGKLIYYDVNNKVRYHCNMNASQAFDNWWNFFTRTFKNSLGGTFNNQPSKVGNRIYFHDYSSSTSNPALVYDIDSMYIRDYTNSPVVTTYAIPCGSIKLGATDTLKGDAGPNAASPGWQTRTWSYWGGNKPMWYSKGGVQKSTPKVPNKFISNVQFEKESNLLTVNFLNNMDNSSAINFDVVDMNGKYILQGVTRKINSNSTSLPIPKLPDGIYLIVLTINGQKEIKKFQIVN